jgi:hypothetical protein
MSTALELIQAVEENGGRFRVDGEWLVVVPKAAATPVREELRRNKPEIIRLLQSRVAMPAEPPLDEGWGLWLLEQCIFKDGWWSGVGCLHLSLACWCANHKRTMPTSRHVFLAALQSEGFQITSDGLVYGLALKEDVLAHERFQQASMPMPAGVHPCRQTKAA